MKTRITSFLFFILSLVPSGGVFYLVYCSTDQIFKTYKFPYPFELFGLAAGLGAASWTYALVTLFRRRKTNMNKIPAVIFIFGFLSIFSGVPSFTDGYAASSSMDNESVSNKLDQIMNVESQILKQLDEIKAELQIVKIRASQR